MTFSIAGRFIGREHPCYLIAEIGVQHRNDRVLAGELITAAARAGADAVKFQAYRADWLATKESAPYWDTYKIPASTQWDYFHQTEAAPFEFYADMAAHAAASGVAFLCTAFDEHLVDELDPLVPAWKIASGDITHEALIRHIASKGKPIILSTGASTLDEIHQALNWLPSHIPVALLHCCLSYPTRASDANLSAIRTLQTFTAGRSNPPQVIGWSDHIVDEPVVGLAYVLGARIIEKHFTLDVDAQGDAFHAWTPETLQSDRREIELYRRILGTGEKLVQGCETAARRYARRSLHVVDGEQRMLRPAF